MKSISLKYGLWAGILLVILSWSSFYLTKSSSVEIAQIGSVLVIFIALGFVPIAIRKTRRLNNNSITFWTAFFTGALTSITPAFCMFVSTIIFMIVQRTDYAEWSMNDTSREIADSTGAVIMHPVEQGVIMFLTVLLFGTIISLISAILLHKSGDH